MMRLVFLSLVLIAGLQAVEYAPQPSEEYRFYSWVTTQGAQWKSADDTLRFDTRIEWKLGMRCAAVDGPRMRLFVTFISLNASHRGPGTDIQVNSETGLGGGDRILGHWLALAGKTLELDVDRATGAVVTVGGGDAIIAEINKRAPAEITGDPPPMDAQARAAFGAEPLARLWSQILALPVSGPSPIALPAPFAAGSSLTRTWKDQAWTASLPKDAKLAFELAKDPTPVRGVVKSLDGSGSIALDQGLPGNVSGKLSFTLAIDTLTQPVETVNAVTWELKAIAPK